MSTAGTVPTAAPCLVQLSCTWAAASPPLWSQRGTRGLLPPGPAPSVQCPAWHHSSLIAPHGLGSGPGRRCSHVMGHRAGSHGVDCGHHGVPDAGPRGMAAPQQRRPVPPSLVHPLSAGAGLSCWSRHFQELPCGSWGSLTSLSGGGPGPGAGKFLVSWTPAGTTWLRALLPLPVRHTQGSSHSALCGKLGGASGAAPPHLPHPVSGVPTPACFCTSSSRPAPTRPECQGAPPPPQSLPCRVLERASTDWVGHNSGL